MSEGIQYDVFASLKVQGGASFVADMGKAAGSAAALQGAFDKVQGGAQRAWGGLSTLGDMALGVVGKVAAVGTASALAVGAGTGSAVIAAGKNLSLLEDKANQLTAVVAAATGRTYGEVSGETASLFQQFKTDAIKSAGETQDFVNTAALIAGPILSAGKGMKDLQELTKGVMATAPAMGASFEQAASDVMRMLQGSAGVELPFFRAMTAIPALGVKSAEAFNKLSLAKRLEVTQKALTNPAFLAAADVAADSFTGLTSTTHDLLKTMGGLAVSPAFEVLKRGMKSVTGTLIAGLDKGGPVRGALEQLGDTVGYRFGQIGTTLGRLFPDLNGSIEGTVLWVERLVDNGLARVVSATTWVADHWPEINAGAKAFAGWISHSAERALELVRTLGGGDLAKGVERAAMLYGGSKVAGPAAQVALGGAQMAQGAVKAGQWAWGLVGAGGAAAGAEAAGAAGAAGAAAGGSGAVGAAGGAAGAALGGAGALATGGLLAGAAAFLATTYLAIEQDTFGFVRFVSSEWDRMMVAGERLWSSLKGLGRQLESMWDAVMQLYESMKPLLGLFASLYAIPVVAVFEGLVNGTTMAADALSGLAQHLQLFASYATDAIGPLAKLMDEVVDKLGLKRKTLSPVDEDGMRRFDAGFAGAPVISTSGALAPGSGAGKKPPGSSAKQHVEVTIKWDLGEGNEEAIYVRSRRDFTETLRNAKSFVRSGPLPGRF